MVALKLSVCTQVACPGLAQGKENERKKEEEREIKHFG